VKHFHNEMIVT